MKKILTALVSALLITGLVAGCSNDTSKYSVSTTTETDTDGNSVTTQTDNETGESLTSYVATLVIENRAQASFTKIYFNTADQETWGDEVLGKDSPLENGEYVTYKNALKYSNKSTIWDLKIVDENGRESEFDDLDLSVRAYNCLKRAGILTLHDLVEKSENEMMKIRNLGKKSLKEVLDKVKELDLTLRDDD